MTAVRNLCKTGILLKNGGLHFSGSVNDVINTYLSDDTLKGIINHHWDFDHAPGFEKIKVKSAYIQFNGNNLSVTMPFDIVTEFWCLAEGFPVNVSMILYDINGQCIFNIFTENKPLKKGLHKAVFHIPANFLNDGVYYVNNMFVTSAQSYFYHEYANSFEIADDRDGYEWYGKWIGAVRPTFIDIEYNQISE
jgi:lipopolysaccharide transport system ATP-binding protein